MIRQHGTLELSRSRFQHNLRVLRGKIGAEKTLCATIKANAYGHGVGLISQLLREEGIEWVCVYSLHEAMELANGPNGKAFRILVLAPVVMPAVVPLPAILNNIRLNVTDAVSARNLAASLGQQREGVRVHIQIDAGLTRVGVEPRDAQELAQTVAGLPGLQLEGLFAHFSHGDVPQHETVAHQLNLLHRAAGPVIERFPDLLIHLQNSGGAWHLTPEDHAGLHMVRVGIALYGLQPSTAAPIPELLPIAQVTGPIVALHQRPPGTGVGYGHTFVTQRHSRLAIVPVGYADGYPRGLSNKMVAQVRGCDVPLVGRVSMDQVILDVTDVPGAGLGETVTLISHDPARENSLDSMADAMGTIGYELATHLGGRLKRILVD